MYSEKDITVVALTQERYEYVEELLSSLAELKIVPSRFILIDGSVKFKDLTNKASAVRGMKYECIRIDPSINQPEGRNIALRIVDTKLTCFLDDDVHVKKSWLQGVLNGFNKFPKAAGITGPTLDADWDLKPLKKLVHDNKNRNYFNAFGMVFDGSPFQVNDAPFECTVMKGANMAFKTGLIKKHGFDEAYVGNALREETDPQIKLVREGHHFIYHPDVFVYHLKAANTGSRKHGDYAYFYESGLNHKYFCDKYFNKLLSRLSWLTLCNFPPSLPACVYVYLKKRKNCFPAHKALWFGSIKGGYNWQKK